MSASSSKTRQKSCIPCASAKRRCDQAAPICSRCASKFLFCTYKSATQTSGTEPQPDPPTSQYDTAMGFPPADGHLGQPPRPLPMLTGHDMGLAISGDGMVGTADMIDDTFFEAYNNHLASPSYPEIGTMDRGRIRYCVRALKSYPSLLFQNGKTPFIHPQCYPGTLPAPLQEACCVSALYCGKSEINESMIWDIISTKVNQLMEPQPSWTVSEHLAHLQTLIIFQIIRLFDGDIKQRSDAEQHEEILAQWTDRLLQRTGITTNSASDILSNSYSSWLFSESISRTIIISRMVQAMFSIQKQGFCTLVGAVTEMSFTAQRALWEAKSEHHWMKCMMEKRGFYVENMEFGEVMERASVNEVDELGLLMLVTYNGVDGVNEWILRSGSSALIE